MTDAEALLAAIIAHPAEDTPRLAYADEIEAQAREVTCGRCEGRGAVGWDWVGGIGQPPKVYTCPECTAPGYVPRSDGLRERAEFIRVQVELAALEAANGTPEFWRRLGTAHAAQTGFMPCQCSRCDLKRRERELWRSLDGHWAADPDLDAVTLGDERHAELVIGVVRRGFVDEVRCPLAAWESHGPAIVRRHPVTRVVATDMPIYPSGGNNTFYVGGLGRLPQKYWSRLEGLPHEWTARAALSAALLELARGPEKG